MTFLELAQMTAQQSGTIQGVLPTTVTGQANRLKLVADLVAEAYLDIQNAHRMWRWMLGRFTGDTIAGQTIYSGTEFSDEISGQPIVRFSQWGFRGDGGDVGLSSYLLTTGPNEEGSMQWLDWDHFYETQLRGPQNPGKPRFYSTTNDDKLIVSPTPDNVYKLRGRYRRTAQRLVADGDVPEMPTDFHTIIKDAALVYLEGYDEGPRIPVYRMRQLPNWSMLEHHQLPKPSWGGPLA